MKTNRAGIDLIKQFEGLRTTAYIDPVGVLTIGYGTTSAAGVGTITKGMKITAERAEEMLVDSLPKYEAGVMRALKRSPNDNQFSAMVSFAYNVGEGAFASSSVCKLFNAGNVQGAADALRLWKYGTVGGKKVVLDGLVKRREAERQLFLMPVNKEEIKGEIGKEVVGWSDEKKTPSATLAKGVGAIVVAAVMALLAWVMGVFGGN